MRTAGVYLLQVDVGNCRMATLPKGDITLTLRVGRSSASANFTNSQPPPSVNFNTTLQLNVDSTALQTQRCSLTLTHPQARDKKILGIALVSVPKDSSSIESTYKMSQSEDKSAELSLKMRIIPIEGSSSVVRNRADLSVESTPVSRMQQQHSSQNIKVQSKMSGGSSAGSEERRLFKVVEEDKMLQISESDMRRIKEEKDAYYQLYQIEKSKNEVAGKFISQLVKRIGEKYPDLLPTSQAREVTAVVSPNPKKYSELRPDKSSVHPASNNEALIQLQQANRSLHRQCDEYRRVCEVLKQELHNMSNQRAGGNPNPNPFRSSAKEALPPMLDVFPTPRENIRDKSVLTQQVRKLARNSPEKYDKDKMADIDFRTWLQQSIGQRQQMNRILTELKTDEAAAMREEKLDKVLNRIKNAMNKSFANLLSRKNVSRDVLMSHRQEVNKLFEEAVAN